MLLSVSAAIDPELVAADLAGQSPDVASLRRSVAAYRPHMEALLRERYGIELLAVYTYPAQVTFCNRPLATDNAQNHQSHGNGRRFKNEGRFAKTRTW